MVFALIILSFILLATFSLSSIARIERKSADISVNSSTAFQEADKGMEDFLQQIYKDLDQNDTLTDLGTALNSMYGGGYDCVEPTGDNHPPVRMGSEDTQFIITPYRDQGDTGTTSVNDSGDEKETGGWAGVIPIESCNTQLADVVRFRSTGNHNNAARAVFLRLKDSLSRGLVAHWSFEDRAQNARLTDDDNLKNSFMAGDSSKNNYTLTLCGLNTGFENNIKIKDGGIDDDGDPIDVFVEPFDNCKNTPPFMSQKKKGGCAECDANGAWVEGIVSEVSGTVGVFGNDGTEALYFNGTDNYITALVDSNDCHGSNKDCDVTANYVDSESVDKLNVEDGIGISAWVKMNGASGNNTIVSKWYDNKGYQLYVDIANSEVCFKLNNKESCKSYGADINSDKWAHIVAMWRNKDSGDINISINADTAEHSDTLDSSIDVPSNVPLSIGAQLDDSQNASASNFFTGSIDDVRIWNRALTECEISRLCHDAFDQDNRPSDAPTCADVPADC